MACTPHASPQAILYAANTALTAFLRHLPLAFVVASGSNASRPSRALLSCGAPPFCEFKNEKTALLFGARKVKTVQCVAHLPQPLSAPPSTTRVPLSISLSLQDGDLLSAIFTCAVCCVAEFFVMCDVDEG